MFIPSLILLLPSESQSLAQMSGKAGGGSCSLIPRLTCVLCGQLRVKQAGVNIQKYVPGLLTQKFGIDEYFSIIHPQVTFSISSICKFINSQFVLKTRREMMPKAWKSQPALKLRGKSTCLSLLPVRLAGKAAFQLLPSQQRSYIENKVWVFFLLLLLLLFVYFLICLLGLISK